MLHRKPLVPRPPFHRNVGHQTVLYHPMVVASLSCKDQLNVHASCHQPSGVASIRAYNQRSLGAQIYPRYDRQISSPAFSPHGTVAALYAHRHLGKLNQASL